MTLSHQSGFAIATHVSLADSVTATDQLAADRVESRSREALFNPRSEGLDRAQEQFRIE
jgi:hypothetical protein